MDFHHRVSQGLSQLNKPHKNRSKSGGKVEVSGKGLLGKGLSKELKFISLSID